MENLKGVFEHIETASNEQMAGFSNIHGAIRLFQDHIRAIQSMIDTTNDLSTDMNSRSDNIIKYVSTLKDKESRKKVEPKNDSTAPPQEEDDDVTQKVA